jgi:hypothetical protein
MIAFNSCLLIPTSGSFQDRLLLIVISLDIFLILCRLSKFGFYPGGCEYFAREIMDSVILLQRVWMFLL